MYPYIKKLYKCLITSDGLLAAREFKCRAFSVSGTDIALCPPEHHVLQECPDNPENRDSPESPGIPGKLDKVTCQCALFHHQAARSQGSPVSPESPVSPGHQGLPGLPEINGELQCCV
ncbi:uncharacterized protein ZBAI_01004 [Zygosaccharomyces bailii ISA1307]|nr:uncharacterized protein ZBAI_01004 [Zygosaccharomyces bailii ISA1307]